MKEHTLLANARLRLERRMFLKAMGLGLSLPLALQLSRLASAQEVARPKRLLVLFRPHGVPPEHYNPVVNGGDRTSFTFTQTGASILAPLEPYKQLVNVLHGFKYLSGGTHESILSFLSNFPTLNDETTPRTTFEHLIANALGNTPPLVLGAAAQRDYRNFDKDTKLTWNGQAVAPEKNPFLAYNKAFASLVDPNAQAQAAVQAQLRTALSALSGRQLENMRTELASLTRVQTKLASHIDALQSLNAGPDTNSCSTLPVLPALEAIRPTLEGRPEETYLDQLNFSKLYAAQLQVAAQALLCNVTPVAVVQPMYTNADFDFSFMGAPGAHHGTLSHSFPQSNGSTVNMTAREPFARAQRWFMDQLVEHVLMPFDQPDPSDPGRKVIDNTIIYICSEIGEGAFHGTNTRVIYFGPTAPPPAYLPLLTIGGGSGGLKTGQVINFNPTPVANTESQADRPAADIYLSISQAMGVPLTSIGNATNPVTEILA